jgi:NADPH-dependent curcumin reductase CurA
LFDAFRPLYIFHLFINKNKTELNLAQFVVKNVYLSLDPAMRGWMNDVKYASRTSAAPFALGSSCADASLLAVRSIRSYIAPVKLGDVMRGQTVGQVSACARARAL